MARAHLKRKLRSFSSGGTNKGNRKAENRRAANKSSYFGSVSKGDRANETINLGAPTISYLQMSRRSPERGPGDRGGGGAVGRWEGGGGQVGV